MAAAESYPDDLRYHSEHDWARIEDGEAVLGISELGQQALVGSERLLPEHDRLGIGRQQRGGDQLLGLVVGDRDQVTGLLLVDLGVRERAEPWPDDLSGNGLHQLQDCIGGHGHGSARQVEQQEGLGKADALELGQV